MIRIAVAAATITALCVAQASAQPMSGPIDPGSKSAGATKPGSTQTSAAKTREMRREILAKTHAHKAPSGSLSTRPLKGPARPR